MRLVDNFIVSPVLLHHQSWKEVQNLSVTGQFIRKCCIVCSVSLHRLHVEFCDRPSALAYTSHIPKRARSVIASSDNWQYTHALLCSIP